MQRRGVVVAAACLASFAALPAVAATLPGLWGQPRVTTTAFVAQDCPEDFVEGPLNHVDAEVYEAPGGRTVVVRGTGILRFFDAECEPRGTVRTLYTDVVHVPPGARWMVFEPHVPE